MGLPVHGLILIGLVIKNKSRELPLPAFYYFGGGTTISHIQLSGLS
ncbi:hypothetical protein JGI13_02035 [Candidatus Kryptonium thompsonii]|nr:hypothetical protein JGI13_02035 [Candidatus Kryptonium thompsoni]